MLLCNDENEDGIFLSLVIKVKDDVFQSGILGLKEKSECSQLLILLNITKH